jgi:hypothetical protein
LTGTVLAFADAVLIFFIKLSAHQRVKSKYWGITGGRSESKLKEFADKYATDRQYVSHDEIEIARSKNILFMEAVKQRFGPLYIDLRRRVEAGVKLRVGHVKAQVECI